MKYVRQEKEVLESWRRCMKSGLSINVPYAISGVKETEFDVIKNENYKLISAFEYAVDDIRQFLTKDFFFAKR